MSRRFSTVSRHLASDDDPAAKHDLEKEHTANVSGAGSPTPVGSGAVPDLSQGLGQYSVPSTTGNDDGGEDTPGGVKLCKPVPGEEDFDELLNDHNTDALEEPSWKPLARSETLQQQATTGEPDNLKLLGKSPSEDGSDLHSRTRLSSGVRGAHDVSTS